MEDLGKLRIDRSAAARHDGGGPAPRWLLLAAVLAVPVVALWLFRAPLLAWLDRLRSVEVRVARAERANPAAAVALSGIAANGYIVAARRAALSADAPGRVVELNVTEGSLVKKGDLIARLYADEYAAALRRAEADLAAAEAAVGRARAQVASGRADLERLEKARAAAEARVAADEAEVALARASLRRQQDLARQGISAPQALDEAVMAVDRAQARVAASQAELQAAASSVSGGRALLEVSEADLGVASAQADVARAARDLAQATLQKTEVRAPFDGVVVLKDAEVGEVVSPNVQGGSSARGSVATMVDFASLEVQCDLPQTSLRAIVVGAPARVFLDAYPDRAYDGRVDRIWPTANRQKGTVEVRVKLLLPDDLLRPEMDVRVVFLPPDAAPEPTGPATAKAAVLVPDTAVVQRDGRPGVFVVDQGVVTFREVQVQEGAPAGRTAVAAGLSGGERVVVDPPGSLDAGDAVTFVEG